jgi:hypothetical protein
VAPSKPLGEHTISVPQLGLSRGLIYPLSHIKQQIRVFQLLAHSSKSNESRFYVDAAHVCFVMRDDARIMNDMNRSYDEYSARRLPGSVPRVSRFHIGQYATNIKISQR